MEPSIGNFLWHLMWVVVYIGKAIQWVIMALVVVALVSYTIDGIPELLKNLRKGK